MSFQVQKNTRRIAKYLSGPMGTRSLIFHTSDVIGTPDSKFNGINVYINGGRLQPGCYTNSTDISQRNSFCKYFCCKIRKPLLEMQPIFGFFAAETRIES